MGGEMAGEWDRVARWAGMGNNRRDANFKKSRDGMVEEKMVQGAEDMDVNAVPEAIESLLEDGGEAASTLKTELEQVRGERDQLLDRLARLQAEFDNARKREAKERQDTRDYAIQGAVEPFLGVMDNFQLALKADGTVEQLRAGVELILKQMEEALKGLNVQPVETVGAMFDPRVHEALGGIETAEFPDHQVMEEIRRGYKIRDKLLRPALVRIASNTAVVSD
jgi:molecular chaperone GrpE